jgi:hypothetical protein
MLKLFVSGKFDEGAYQTEKVQWLIAYYIHGKKRRARCSTGLNNVLLPTLFTLVNNIEQYC